MVCNAKILGYDGTRLVVAPLESIDRELLKKQVNNIEIRLVDGRHISNEQRKYIFAIVRDIADWCGYIPEELRGIITWKFCELYDIEPFSLSDVDMTTAKQFLDYLINFCLENGVPTRDSLLTRTDDINRYLYRCLEHRKCAICNRPADVHHVDRVGIGRNRNEIMHQGMKAIALCREHHQLAHLGEKALFEKYRIYGIRLDEYLCKRLHLNTKDRSNK